MPEDAGENENNRTKVVSIQNNESAEDKHTQKEERIMPQLAKMKFRKIVSEERV